MGQHTLIKQITTLGVPGPSVTTGGDAKGLPVNRGHWGLMVPAASLTQTLGALGPLHSLPLDWHQPTSQPDTDTALEHPSTVSGT